MIVDSHVHLTRDFGGPVERARHLLTFADRLGIGNMVLMLGPNLIETPNPDGIRADNDFVWKVLEAFPQRYIGYVYLSVAHPEFSIEEMKRCIVDGPMRGIKLWVCRKCSDPAADKIAEKATELGVPILQHTWIKITGNMPGESEPKDLVALARRHPAGRFLMAHSGGDWERGIRTIEDTPNIITDLSGGHPEAGQTEFAVKYLGAERVVWGSDADGRSLASQLAKVTSANISEAEKGLILAGNIERILKL
jgi:predicted TIM-barrel fold metal-dependent hydrolase